MNKETAVNSATNGAKDIIEYSVPYTVECTIEGTAKFLFHRWNVEAVEAKAGAAKGSKAKKSDDVESYVYRDDAGRLAIPGEYIKQSVVNAARFVQDPRSPRKSAMDLFKAGVVAMDELCSLGVKDWDYLDRRRVVVQRNGITRVRPALREGWKIRCNLMVLLPEYISQQLLLDRLNAAGRLVGIGDNRPSHGRFQVTNFKVKPLDEVG